MFSRRQFFKSIGGVGALSASTAAYGFGVEPELRLRTTRYELAPRQWPADFPLKIAAIADIHACDPWMSLEYIERIVERTNALNADLIVMLGDYVAGHRHVTRFIPASEWAAVLANLKAPLGVHAIMGNHDYWEDKTVQRLGRGPTVARRALEARGIPVYENDAVRLTKPAARSGSPGSAINWPIFRRGVFATSPASASTISLPRLRKSPTMRP
jgi:predicted MPP superfamily phosphohydrolase